MNYSAVDNKILKLTDEEDRLFHDPNVGWGLTPTSEFVLEVGKPMAGMWGVNYLGTWKPGEAAEAELPALARALGVCRPAPRGEMEHGFRRPLAAGSPFQRDRAAHH